MSELSPEGGSEGYGGCDDDVLRIMSFLEEATGKELVLPVTPAKYFWRHPNAVETVRLDQLGEITLPGGVKMGDCTLEDVLLPAQLYPFCVPGARAAPYVQDVKAANAEPLLMQIRLPANYGRRYNEAFSAIYPKLAKEFDVPLLPFFMEEVYLKPQWMQDDGIHPNRDAQPFIADWMAKQLQPLVNHDS